MVVLVMKTTTITCLTVGRCEQVKLTPHVSQLMIEGIIG
jgi:hypothetical protein